jgi:biopolymer transport protein ExbD
MKKRILLSLVSFFMMTATWASLTEAYKITVSAENGKTYENATLTLNMDNRNAISIWSCTVVLPQGVTYVDGSAAIVDGRYPEGYCGTEEAPFNPLTVVVSEDGSSVTITCAGPVDKETGKPLFALTGTAGAVATIQVAVAGGEGGAVVGENEVKVTNTTLTEIDGTSMHIRESWEGKWTIEEGTAPGKKGDVNNEGDVSVADFVAVLNAMAGAEDPGDPDVNGDGDVSIADAVAVLNIMAGGE